MMKKICLISIVSMLLLTVLNVMPVSAEPEPMCEINKYVKNEDGSWDKNVSVDQGEDVSFLITLVNTGNITITNLELYDFLPESLIYLGNANIPPFIIDEYCLYWVFYNFQPGHNITISFNALTTVTGFFTNVATFFAVVENESFTYGNDSASVSVHITEIDVNQSKFDRGFPIRYANDGSWGGAQSFTPTVNTITSVLIYLRKFGAPTFNLKVELRKNSPTGTLLDTIIFTPSQVASTWNWLNIDFDDNVVAPNITYFIVIPPPSSNPGNNFGYEWGYALGNQYAGGSYWFTRNGGLMWRDLPTMYEFTFKTYGYN